MPNHRLTSLRISAAVALTIGLATGAAPAVATTRTQGPSTSPPPGVLVDQIAAAVEAATGTADVLPAGRAEQDGDGERVVSTPLATVDVPRDPGRPIAVTIRGGNRIIIGFPRSDSGTQARTTSAGTTVFVDADGRTASAVQATAEGVRQLFAIPTASAPATFTIALTLPVGASLIPDGRGGFDISAPLGRSGSAITLAHIAAPWAKDAIGKAMPTSYTVDGTRLTQHVDTVGAAYPVIADPQFTWGWVTGTIYFNKPETALAAVSGAYAGFWARFVPGWGTALGAYAATLSSAAGLAVARNECLKVKLPVPIPGGHSGGYCR